SGVHPRWETGRDARLEIVGRREGGIGEFGRLIGVILPVVVRADERSVIIPKLQCRVSQWVGYSRSETGTYSADDNPAHAGLISQDETRDHDITARADAGAGADVAQPGCGSGVGMENFNQADAHRVNLAAHHRGIV